jgi:hypothetical protein
MKQLAIRCTADYEGRTRQNCVFLSPKIISVLQSSILQYVPTLRLDIRKVVEGLSRHVFLI